MLDEIEILWELLAVSGNYDNNFLKYTLLEQKQGIKDLLIQSLNPSMRCDLTEKRIALVS